VSAGWPLDPFTLRQPDGFGRKPGHLIGGRDYRRDEHLIAEHVFVAAAVCFVCLRPVVVERMQKSYAALVSTMTFGIKIRLQRIAHLER
jgi:hypothetical protein